MFTRKPLWMIREDAETEGGESDAPEADDTETGSTGTSGGDADPDDDEEADQAAEEAAAFDAERALKKIRKANSEAKTQRERAKAAEEKAKGLEPHKRDADLQRVARRLGLPDNEDVDNFLSRLQGESFDELAEDAERLLSLMSKKSAPATRPKERLRGGGDPTEEPAVDAQKIVDSLPRF